MKKRRKLGFMFYVIISCLLVIIFFVSYTHSRELKRERKLVGILKNHNLENLDSLGIGDLTSDKTKIKSDCEDAILFSVCANVNSKEVISLYKDGHFCCDLYDDGSNGDLYKGDGKFSALTKIVGNDGDTLSFQAEYGDRKSNVLNLRAYDTETEQEIDELIRFNESIQNEESLYLIDGYVPTDQKEEVLEHIYEFANLYAQKRGTIDVVNKSSESVYILFNSGAETVYIPREANVKSGDDAISIQVLEPYSCDIEIADRLPTYSDDVYEFDYYCHETELGNLLQYDAVSVESIIDTFVRDSIILWNGHGDILDDNNQESKETILCTNIPVNKENALKYENLIAAGALMSRTDKTYAITTTFFKLCVEDLTNSFVYLGSCFNGRDEDMMYCLLEKGATACMGYSDSVLVSYDSDILSSILTRMSTINGNDYYSLGEAKDYAVLVYGDNDGDETPAYIKIYGDENYRISDAFDRKSEWFRAHPPTNKSVFAKYGGVSANGNNVIITLYSDGTASYNENGILLAGSWKKGLVSLLFEFDDPEILLGRSVHLYIDEKNDTAIAVAYIIGWSPDYYTKLLY